MTVAIVRKVPPCDIVPIVRVRREGHVLRFVDPCPYCNRRHIHGIGDGGKNGWFGHRVGHCQMRNACGYYLIEESAPIPQEPTP